MTKELSAIVRTLLGRPGQGPAVLATLVTVEGSSYRRPGARLLVVPGMDRIGSISGGCLEEDVLARSAQVAKTGLTETVVYDTTSENDLVWGVGLGCHGIVRVVIERIDGCPAWVECVAQNLRLRRNTFLATTYEVAPGSELGTRLGQPDDETRFGTFVQQINPPPLLNLFGAGDDARPLVRAAKEMGWTVAVADPRSAFATPTRFPEADLVRTGPTEGLADQMPWDEDTLAVIMTHHYVHDLPLLRSILPRANRYVGLLGPRQRAERILADLSAEGFTLTESQRQRLYAPVGLDIGADGPEQVALAIMAEMQAVLRERDARSLRERRKPIHEHPAPGAPSEVSRT